MKTDPRLPVFNPTYNPGELHVGLRLATGQLLRVDQRWWKKFLKEFYWEMVPAVKA